MEITATADNSNRIHACRSQTGIGARVFTLAPLVASVRSRRLVAGAAKTGSRCI
jgi:hypothetical protein